MTNERTRKLVGGLLKLFSGGVVIGVGVVAPNAIPLIEAAIKTKDKIIIAAEYKRLINHMKRLNLISVDRLADDGAYVSLTKKGSQRLQDVYIEDIVIKRPENWDGLWRVVAFDIPRNKKAERNELLSQLHRLGFIGSLQSMWVHPYPCTEEIYAIAKLIGIEKFIMVFEGKTTQDQHKYLLKKFRSILPKHLY